MSRHPKPGAPEQGQAWGPPGTPPPQSWARRHQTVLIVVAAVAAVLVYASAKNQAGNSDDGQTCHAVVYTVTASGPIAVTFETQQGQTSQRDVASGSFTERFCGDVGSFVYVSAQVQIEGGRVACKITSSGAVVATNSSSGDFVIASCKGSA